MDLEEHKKDIIEGIEKGEIDSYNDLISFLEVKKQQICYQLLRSI